MKFITKVKSINFKWIRNLFRVFRRSEEFVYVAIGDSTVEGIGASHSSKSFPSLVFEKIKKDKKEAVFYNFGKGGAKVRDVITYQLPKVIALKPNLVTVSVGGNDLHRKTKLKHFKNDYYYLIKTLRESTNAEIIISNIPDVSLLPSLSIFIKYFAKFMTIRLNKVINELSDQFKCNLIDLYNGSRENSRRYSNLISSDGFHPSDRGYSLWANAITALL